MEILSLKRVTKEFDNKIIIDNVNFSIQEGDIFGIIGQSGSGKSTLLNLLIGFYEPDEGNITFQLTPTQKPKSIHQNRSEIKQKFGFAAQVSSFYPKLTAKENILHFGKLYGIKDPSLKNNVQNLMEFTELTPHQNKLGEHLSVGMQKRLDLSCSLIHKPKILLLDEPTADLDPLIRKEILYLIQQANRQGITIVIASHHLSDIEEICNKVAVVHNGKICTWGTIADVKKPYVQKESAIHIDAGQHHSRFLEKAKHLPITKIVDRGNSLAVYSPEIQNTLSALIDLAQKEEISLQDVDIKKPTLKDVFEFIIKEKNQ